jgi:galactokinase
MEADGGRVRDFLRGRLEAVTGRHVDDVRHGLGEVNTRIVMQARDALLLGDGEKLGAVMAEAQEAYDRYLAPVDPERFRAPLLHDFLRAGDIRALTWGGKRLGTASDGMVLVVARGPEARRRLLKVLNEKGRAVKHALPLTIPGSGAD